MEELYKKANLKRDEILTLKLRGLFEEAGFEKYTMNKFEEYSLYAENKDFLSGDRVITFTDLDGTLMALKPDVTLSIIKNIDFRDTKEHKIYYIENVYRENKGSNNYVEIPQMGLEYIGEVNETGIEEVLDIAGKALGVVGKKTRLVLSHMDFVEEIFKEMDLSKEVYLHLLKLVRNKNGDGIIKVGEKYGIGEENIEILCQIPRLVGPFKEILKEAKKIKGTKGMTDALVELEKTCLGMEKNHGSNLLIDLSMVNDIDYYNGIIFRGYVEGTPSHVLAGGQYNRAMKLLKKQAKAIGFAVYLNELIKGEETSLKESGWMTIALPKGRLGDQVYDILAKGGYQCPGYKDKNRKLVMENPEKKIRYILVKPGDVAVYVEHGGADVGIVGKDILIETMPDVYELKDLKLGKCNMVVAGPTAYQENPNGVLRVATKYVNTAKGFYREKNRDIEIIKLNGSIELGPILNLSHVIVDIVETGKTLKDNDLEVKEYIKPISARLIANKGTYKFLKEKVDKMVLKIGEQIE